MSYTFLSEPLPSASKEKQRLAKVQWYGLNLKASADSGYISSGKNFYVTTDGTLRAVDVPTALDNIPSGDPLAFVSIDGRMFYVYATSGKTYIMRIDGNERQRMELSDDTADERSLARFNMWFGGSDIVSGIYKSRLLIYPDAKWLPFDRWDDTDFAKGIQQYEIIQTMTVTKTTTQETYNTEVKSAKEALKNGTWYYDAETDSYFVGKKPDGRGVSKDESTTESTYGYADENDGGILPAEQRTLGDEAVSYYVSETMGSNGNIFKMLTVETVQDETVTSYRFRATRYVLVEKVTVTKTTNQKHYDTEIDKTFFEENADGYWYYDKGKNEYVVSTNPSGESDEVSRSVKESVIRDASSDLGDKPATESDEVVSKLLYEVETTEGIDGTEYKMLNVYQTTTVTDKVYYFKDLGSDIPSAKMITPYNNRIFGVDGTKIFASAAGSYVNYDLDTATDYDENNAWYSATQSGGDFTHICTFGGKVVAFKKDMLYELYNTKNPFRILEVNKIGTFTHKSVCELAGNLFYASDDGVYVYGGSAPYNISEGILDKTHLKNSKLTRGVAGANDGKYYIREPLKGESGKPILVFDTATKTWSITDFNQEIAYFANADGHLYACTTSGAIYQMDSGNKADTEWYFETPVICESTADVKWLEKVQLVAKFHTAGQITVKVKYDNDTEYTTVATLGKDTGIHSLYAKVAKSDHVARFIRIECVGDVEILTFEQLLSGGGARYGG